MGTVNELSNKPLILIIDDQKETLDSFGGFFRDDHGFEVITAQTSEEAVKCIERITRPAVVILDRMFKNNHGDVVLGEDLLKILLQRSRFPIVTIFFSVDNSLSAHLNSIESGGDWYLPKDADERLIIAHVWRAVHLMRRLVEPNKDPLTGALNRRGMFDRAIRELSHAERLSTTTTCMMFDVDKLKPINDTHGHKVGDKVILCVVNALQDRLRPTDIICRWGGDEILVFLFDVKEEGAVTFADDLCSTISSKCVYIDDEDQNKGQVSISASVGMSLLSPVRIRESMKSGIYGVQQTPIFMDLLLKVINEADKNMYKVKKSRV